MRALITFIFLLFFVCTYAQTDSNTVQTDSTIIPEKKKTVTLNGYVKILNGMLLLPNDQSAQWGLLHNRINSKWKPNKNFIAALDVRNRIVYGESVKLGNYPSSMLDKDGGLVDATFLPFDSKAAKMISSVERLWTKISNDKIELTLGRQRINWGVNLVWNPNDIFNTYSFVDFDYEERPGSDAAVLKYNISTMSSITAATKVGKHRNDDVYALMYKLNKWNYDFQFLTSWYEKDIAAGLGWAGSIGNVGFKGEGTYFHPRKNNSTTADVINTSIEFDYAFNGKVYANASYLFFNNGLVSTSSLPGNLLLNNTSISAKQMSPSKHSAFLQLKSISNPIFSGGISAIYFFEINTMYLFPSLTYSINDRLEAALFIQSVCLTQQQIKSEMNNVMIRLKCSF